MAGSSQNNDVMLDNGTVSFRINTFYSLAIYVWLIREQILMGLTSF